jgi:DNA-binding Lrp family transcriptional regulator
MFETGLSLHPAQRELKNLFDLGIIKGKGAWGQASTINTSQ